MITIQIGDIFSQFLVLYQQNIINQGFALVILLKPWCITSKYFQFKLKPPVC